MAKEQLYLIIPVFRLVANFQNISEVSSHFFVSTVYTSLRRALRDLSLSIKSA